MSSFKHAFILQIIVSRFNSVYNKQIKITQTRTHTGKSISLLLRPPPQKKKIASLLSLSKFMTTMTTATKF